jgi:hypothetical protein
LDVKSPNRLTLGRIVGFCVMSGGRLELPTRGFSILKQILLNQHLQRFEITITPNLGVAELRYDFLEVRSRIKGKIIKKCNVLSVNLLIFIKTVRKKKNKIWIWTAVDHFKPGILGWATPKP